MKPGSKHRNTWISQPGSSLEKRQYSLQVMFRPEDQQPCLAIIFKGRGKRITDDKKLAYQPDVDIYLKKKRLDGY